MENQYMTIIDIGNRYIPLSDTEGRIWFINIENIIKIHKDSNGHTVITFDDSEVFKSKTPIRDLIKEINKVKQS